MDKDYILSVIWESADESLGFEENRYLPRDYFIRRSYQRWAIYEIMKRIEESDGVPPIRVVEDFTHQMERFSHKKGKPAMIFSIARDTAMDILDILDAML